MRARAAIVAARGALACALCVRGAEAVGCAGVRDVSQWAVRGRDRTVAAPGRCVGLRACTVES